MKLTYADYASIPPDGRVWQVLDGEATVTPVPSPQHQRASKRLQRQLEAFFEATGKGDVFNAPIDLILGPHDVSQPDLVVVTDPSMVTRRGIEAPPLLVAEVLSPSTAAYDREAKARRYAALGVPHYWILDPDAQRLECWRNDGGTYVLAANASGDETLASPDFEGLAIDLAAIWR
ncbi:MAG: Uma2 family endonuclease [Vicinamibacterales bacterium]